MTSDLLLKPEDTGEIPPADRGMTTQNLAPYAAELPPPLRRPDAVAALIVDYGKAPSTPPTLPPAPDPLPPPPPPTPNYVGRHRRRSLFDWLTVPLSAWVQRRKAADR